MLSQQQVPLNYPSLRAILRHSSFQIRRKLVKKVVSLRKVNKRIPCHFDEVKLTKRKVPGFVVQIDDMKWTFKTKNGRNWRKGSVMDLVNTQGTVLKYHALISDVYKLINYFFNGRTERIKRLIVEDLELWSDTFRVPLIDSLIIDQHRGVFKTLEAFEESKIKSLKLHVRGTENTWDEPLSKLQCDSAKITTFVDTSDTFFDSIHFRKTEIRESFSNEQKFLNVIKRLEIVENLEEYSYCAEITHNDTELWEALKTRYFIEIEHENYLLIRIDGLGFKILVERWIDSYAGDVVHRVQTVSKEAEASLLECKLIEYTDRFKDLYIIFSSLKELLELALMHYLRWMQQIYQ